jgi:hypothetical protein
MTRRDDLAGFSRALEGQMVLSVYIARENEDPGMGSAWMKRLEVRLGDLRADLEAMTPSEVPAFDRAVGSVLSSLESFGRVLPHEGWCAFSTEDRLWLAEALPFRPSEMVRWRLGAAVAPYVRALKEERPVVLAVLSGLHANVYRYEHGELSQPIEVHAEWPPAEAGDVGISKRASRASGVRGATKADYAKRAQDENVRRHHKQLEDVLREMAGDDDVVMLGGTQKAIHAVRKDLEELFRGHLVELPEVTYDSPRAELISHLRGAASRLTEERQAELLDACEDPHKGSTGWNETYRALAAGAVDKLLVSRGMVEATPDDAERLVRLALAQGAAVEEVGGELAARLTSHDGGVCARLRFMPASLQA